MDYTYSIALLFVDFNMTLYLPQKPSLEEFIQTFTPLAIIEQLEDEMQERVNSITSALLGFSSHGTPVENLAHFLKADRDFLGVILALTNLSQEKFLRILSAERFGRQDFGNEWGIHQVHRKLAQQENFAERIATMLLEGSDNPILAEHVAHFYLAQLNLQDDWEILLRSPQIVERVVRRKLEGEYNDKKGEAVENIIKEKLDDIEAKYGVTHEKGQVQLVSKEVDHVIPSRNEPYVMIMTSYMETTSSMQTTRANEQSSMYQSIISDNIRYGTKRVLVNFVDGAGWLARRSDLRKLHAGCDDVINLKTLDRLEAIICKYVPEKYFTIKPRPQVEG